MVNRFSLQHLRKLLPEGLVDRTASYKKLEVESFFLSLAMLFNDIKGIAILQRDFKEKYEKPTMDISGHNGEWNGINLQIIKYSVGILHEALKLFESHKSTIVSKRFQTFVQHLSQQDVIIWNLVLEVCEVIPTTNNIQDDLITFKTMLLKLRNNVAFHYYQSGKSLVEGYRKFFFKNNKQPKSQSAMYSDASTDFLGTRYYYVDAALMGIIEDELAKIDGTANPLEEIFKLVIEIAKVISGLLRAYHKTIPAN